MAVARQLIASGCLPHDADQFNSLHERLIARWRAVAGDNFVHLACMMRNLEDRVTLAYIEDCARQAGLATKALDMGDIGLDRSTFVDRSGRAVRHLFKLYAWEWMFADPFGNSPAISTTRFVEPLWKMILSNKGMLALLWEMAPEHPNLLPCHFEDDADAARLRRYARKPLYSREGARTSSSSARAAASRGSAMDTAPKVSCARNCRSCRNSTEGIRSSAVGS